MKKYHIRFNQQHNGSGFVWRVFEDGVEYLVKHVKINVPCFDEETVEYGATKWNIVCNGYMNIADDIATIN
jgi:hypothetical protein